MKAHDSGALSAEDLLALARLEDDGAPAAPSPARHGPGTRLSRPATNGATDPAAASLAAPATPDLGQRPTRLSSMRTGLIAGAAILTVVLIFIIQNTHSVDISLLGAHLQLPLAVALLLGAVAGALLMAAAGTARITQLRRVIRRARPEPDAR